MSDRLDPLGIVGTTLDDKYRIDHLCGEGGYSAVYRAEHLVWSEPVAIKFFTLLEDAKPELRERLLGDFIQEGKLMTQLSSRSAAIVQARDIGKLVVDDDKWIPYMVLEWLDGDALDVVLRRERDAAMPARTLQETIALLDPVAVALEVAHQSGVAHRDLKPANIVLMGDARIAGVGVKVLDFGIAKVMAEHQQLNEQLQQTGQQITAFTPNYGSPEQFSRNFGATGPWTDVYAMALILIELLRGGVRALSGQSFFELGVKSCDANARPTPRALGLEVSDEVEQAFRKALSLQPRDRYATMGELWSALYPLAFGGREWTRPRQLLPSGGVRPRAASGLSQPITPSQLTPSRITGDRSVELSQSALVTDASLAHEATIASHTSPMAGPPPFSAGASGTGPSDASTMANLAAPVAEASKRRGLWIGAVAGLAAAGIVAVVLMSPGRESSGPAAPPAPETTADKPEPDTVTTTTTTTEATTTSESEAPATSSSVPVPPPVSTNPIKRPPPPPPKGDNGVDPFDPNSFGGRR